MHRSLIIVFAVIGLASCDLINPDEEVSSYIHIENIDLAVRDGGEVEGQPSHNIKDVWLNIDNVLIGAYEMPVDIPVIGEGPVNVKIFGGIQVNGISTERIRYPFYDFYDGEVDLIADGTIEIEPTLNYIDEVLVFNNEDFEEVGFQFERSITSDTIMEAIENPDMDDVLRGSTVGAIYLDDERDHFKVNSTLELDLAFKNLAYLEIDYKCDGPFVVGLRRSEPSILDFSVAGFNPALNEAGVPVWNKVYVEFNSAIDFLGNEEQYEIFLEGTNTGTETKTYLFDNIKIIHPLQ